MSDAGGFYPDPYRNDRIDIEERAPPRLNAPEEHSWVFGAKLGAGGFGRAYLWNLISNADQKVVDRVVLKYTEVRSEQIISNGGLGHGHIKEVFLQRYLVPNGTSPDKVFTVPLLGAEHCSWSLDSWRYYSPYFAFGDLFDLIKTQGVEDLRGSTMSGHRQIPEPFAWYILYRLVSAAVVMDTAFRTSQKDYKVVHVDLKPENIFLGAPGSLGKNNSFPVKPSISILICISTANFIRLILRCISVTLAMHTSLTQVRTLVGQLRSDQTNMRKVIHGTIRCTATVHLAGLLPRSRGLLECQGSLLLSS